MKRRARLLSALAVAAGLAAAGAILFVFTLPDVRPLARLNPGDTAVMAQRRREAARLGRAFAVRREWTPLTSLPRHLTRAVLVAEDAGFYDHHGVDFTELREAVRQNWREKRIVRGASTITQQLAKNLYLSTDRTPWRKLRELAITRRLERDLGKNRILELYLNVIEMGPGIFGVGAAARHFFGKPAASLTPIESARLVAVIPRPLSSSPTSGSRWITSRSAWILRATEASPPRPTPTRSEPAAPQEETP